MASKYRPPDIALPEPPVALSGLPDLSRPFTVLGIETSCDDTGAAVVRSDGRILGEALASQAKIHAEWGGVVPGLAMKSHQQEIDRVVAAALARAGLASAAEVDAVAVTAGPGLEICLRVGCEAAKALALEHGKPFVAVHHLEAHSPGGGRGVPFPFLALLTSGGHLQLLLCEDVGGSACWAARWATRREASTRWPGCWGWTSAGAGARPWRRWRGRGTPRPCGCPCPCRASRAATSASRG
ncbi:unnamed protein product [Heterosigma akashiwo]